MSLIPARLKTNERNFVLFAGLKGAVPILLGILVLAAHRPGTERLYGIIAVVVVFSVVVQGSLIPAAARLLRVQMRAVEPQPWALGVRLRDEPSGVHHLTIRPGRPPTAAPSARSRNLPGDAWVSFVVREGQLVPITEDMRLRPGDKVLVLADPGLRGKLTAAFEGRLRGQCLQLGEADHDRDVRAEPVLQGGPQVGGDLSRAGAREVDRDGGVGL